MRTIISAVLLVCLGIGSAFAAEAEQKKDTFGSQGSIRYDPNSNTTTNNKVEGADITINYRWSLSSLLGEPILKCQAAWQPIGVYVKRSSTSEPTYIETKNLPPKVAASIKVIDLTVNATARSQFAGTTFDCNVGIPAAAGKEYSYNLPTSPDWHEALGYQSFRSKEDNANDNKAKFKKMLTADPRWLAMDFEYQVRTILFDLSGVRDWLAEQEEKALAKKAKGPKAKKGNLEEARAALASTKEANAAARVEAAAAAAQTKAHLDEKERRFKEKVAALEQKNVLAGTWKRDGLDLVIEIPTIDKWSEEGGTTRIVNRPQKWGPKVHDSDIDVKFKNIRLVSEGIYDCIDLVFFVQSGRTKWNRCSVKMIDKNRFLLTDEENDSVEYSRVQ